MPPIGQPQLPSIEQMLPQSPSMQQVMSMAQPQTQPVQTQPKQNWLQRLLPTLGSVAGYGVGALLAPETGGASLALGALGSGLGEAAGKVGENVSSGQSATSGVGGDLLGGSLGGLAGGVAGGVLGKLGEGLVSKGASSIAQQADQDVIDAATNAQKATELNFGGVSQEMQSGKNLALGNNQEFVNSMGLDKTNPYDMQKVSQIGSDLNGVYDNALQSSAPVDMKDINSQLLSTVNDNQNGAVTPITQALNDYFRVTGKPISATLENQLPATEARQLQQAVGRQIGNIENITNHAYLSNTYNGELQGQLNQLHELYNSIGDKIKTPELNQTLADTNVSPADEQGYIAKYGPQLGKYLTDTINNSNSADGLLDPMQKTTQMSKLSNMAIDDIENKTGTARATARQQFASNGGVMPSKASPKTFSQTVGEAAGKATTQGKGAAVAHLLKGTLTPENAQKFGSILSRMAPATGTAVTAAASLPAIGAPGGQTDMQNTASTQQQQPYNALNAMLAAGILDPNQYGGILSTLAPLIQKSQAEQQLLQGLQQQFQQAGGAQGFGGGLLSNIQSMLPGTPQHAYMQARNAAANQGAQFGLTPGILPNFMSNPQTAGQQFGTAQNVLSQMPL